MKTLGLLVAGGLCLAAFPAFAQSDTQQTTVVTPSPSDTQQTTTTVVTPSQKPTGAAAGAVTGAVAGAVVGGPVGAAVGAVAGAVIGSNAAPPGEVRTYVTTQTSPSVTYGHPIAMGRTIDGDVVWLDVPSQPKYRWAYLDGHRVVVDTDTHKVVAIY